MGGVTFGNLRYYYVCEFTVSNYLVFRLFLRYKCSNSHRYFSKVIHLSKDCLLRRSAINLTLYYRHNKMHNELSHPYPILGI